MLRHQLEPPNDLLSLQAELDGWYECNDSSIEINVLKKTSGHCK